MSAQSSVLTLPDLSRFCQTIPAELPSLPLAQKRELPRVPAVYLAIGEHNEVLYIGQSGSLLTRWLAHNKWPELQRLGGVRLAWIELETEEFLADVERVLIRHFSPRLNGPDPREGTRSRMSLQLLFRVTDEEKRDMQRAADAEDR